MGRRRDSLGSYLHCPPVVKRTRRRGQELRVMRQVLATVTDDPNPPDAATARGLIRRPLATADDPAVAAREVDRLVAVVPAHPVVLELAVARHDLEHFALAAGLADVRAFHGDPVTRLRVHGEPPFEALPSDLSIAARLARRRGRVERLTEGSGRARPLQQSRSALR